MANGKALQKFKDELNDKGCEVGRANRLVLKQMKDSSDFIIKLSASGIIAPILVGIILYVLLKKG